MAWFHGTSFRTATWFALTVVAVAAAALRFYRTSQAPPGFYWDEAAVSAQVICLAEAGRTLDGEHWPLMTPVLGGGYSTIGWQAPAVAWSKAAGRSIAAMRDFAAVCGVATIVGVFFVGLFATGSRRIGLYAAVSAAISPWAIQFSRIAWDPAIAPAYLTWAMAFLLLATTPRADRPRWLGWIAIVLSALLFAIACISYPPLRAEVPLVLLAFLVWKHAHVREHLPRAVVFVAVFALCTAQLWLLTQSGAIQGRFESLSVFSASYWAPRNVTARGPRVVHGLWLFATNMFAHFAPSYLFTTGDENLRHSTQSFGAWSWLDALALFAAAIVMARQRKRPSGWMMFAAVGYLAGLCPAALTRDGVPHALRSIGALPFLAVLVGTAIETISDLLPRGRQLVPVAAGAVALVFSVAFWRVFLLQYPAAASAAFNATATQRLLDPRLAQRFTDVERSPYPPLASRYYQLATGAVRCTPNGVVLVYSNRSASIGSSVEARRAGHTPKSSPITVANANASAIDVGPTAVVHPNASRSAIAPPTPVAMPIAPPSRQSVTASIRN